MVRAHYRPPLFLDTNQLEYYDGDSFLLQNTLFTGSTFPMEIDYYGSYRRGICYVEEVERGTK